MPLTNIETETGGESLKAQQSELHVYTRPITISMQEQESNSRMVTPRAISPPNDLNQDELPIAHRKSVRSCTQHPISHYCSYSRLSTSHRAFTTKLSKIVTSRNVEEALNDPKWQKAVLDEIEALEKKMGLGKLQNYGKGRNQLSISGFSQ